MISKKIKVNKKNITPVSDGFVARSAKRSDAQSVWEVRNHPASRAVSHQTQEISLADHKKWFAKKYFSGQDNHCFVLDRKGRAVGYCRFDWSNNEKGYIISIALAPLYQGRGLGSRFLAAALGRIKTDKC